MLHRCILSARNALEEALGFSLSGEDSGEGTGGELSARENPIPLGQEAQVGPWEVTVVEATLDADDTVHNHSEFNEPPQAGNQYVIIKIAATRTGEEAAAFWVDTYYQFVGSKGNTFDVGYADIPDSINDTNEAHPGASVSGNLFFEVPSDQVAGGTLRLTEAFSLEDVEVFLAVDWRGGPTSPHQDGMMEGPLAGDPERRGRNTAFPPAIRC